MDKETIYLDSAATTKPFPEVIAAMTETMKKFYGNPSSLHKAGLEAELILRDSRKNIARALECNTNQVFFTSSATEANNWAIEAAWELKSKKGNILIASETDHPSVLQKLEAMKKRGAVIELLPVNKNGLIEPECLDRLLNDKVIFISVLWVNNETGVIQELEKLIASVRNRSPHCLIHTDAVQAFCKLKDARLRNGIDYMSLSSHKIGGPKGAGALAVANPVTLPPFIYGGGQESGKRAGTENVAGLQGFGVACEMMAKNLDANYKKVERLKNIFEKKILSELPDILINGKDPLSAYISSISIKGLAGEVLVHSLAENGVIVSTGSACSSKREIHSRVLKAMGLQKEWLPGSVRISYFSDIAETEIEKAAGIFIKTVKRLRG